MIKQRYLFHTSATVNEAKCELTGITVCSKILSTAKPLYGLHVNTLYSNYIFYYILLCNFIVRISVSCIISKFLTILTTIILNVCIL